MIITCGECATQFQLDEARVPESGIRVRCSVCKHAFFAAHPDALDDGDGDPVARVVGQVLDAEAGELSEATADLEIPHGLAGSTGSGHAGDEESWQFSDEGASSASAARDPRDRFEESFEAARDAVDSLLGSPWQAPETASASLPVEAGDEASETWAPPAEIDPPAADDATESPPRSDDPWETPAWPDDEKASAGQWPEEAVSRASAPPLLEPSSPLDGELRASEATAELDEGRAAFDELEIADEGRAAFDDLEVADEGACFDDTALGEAVEDFESAEELDSEPFALELSDPDGSSDLATPEDWGLDAPSEGASLEHDEIPATAGVAAAVATPLPIAFGPALEREPHGARARAWLVRAGNALGWGAVAFLAAVTLWSSVAPRSAPTRAAGSQALAGLEATGVEGRWVENATLGSLYVVSGELHNPGTRTKAPGAKLVVRMLDARGEPVVGRAASLGLPLDARLLREGRAVDLAVIGEAGALELAHTPLAPGARIAFEAAVVDLPDTASRFDLTTASR